MYSNWATAYLASTSVVQVTYNQSSSGEGVDDLIAGKVLFAGSDFEPSNTQFQEGKQERGRERGGREVLTLAL